ncbi:YdcF family protein [Salinicoccus roseus]|uniref:YdcF family protein n=1 Tax=Salinicoccus roseus TaxID=45670 RepID=UPI0035258A4A
MKARILIILMCIILLLIVISLIDSFDHGYSDEPIESDLIVMLGGGEAARMQMAASLYHEGYADYVLITPVIESDDYNQSSALAMEYGIPEEALILEYEANSTYTNVTITMDIMNRLDMDSALIVTSDWHIKRSKYIYDKLNDGSFEFRYISALPMQDGRWNESGDAFYIWYSEYIKLWVYRMGIYWWSE